MQGTLLIVDDKADIRLSLHLLLKNSGFTTIQCSSLSAAAQTLAEQPIDLVLLDMNYELDTTSGQEGLNFLSEHAVPDPSSPAFIAMTAWSSVNLAVEAMQRGAVDFFAKPWDNHAVLMMIKKHLGLRQMTRTQQSAVPASKQTLDKGLLWLSPQMQTLKKQLDRVAPTGANILLRGENGTGKSHIAQYLHQHSARAGKLVSVNMAAIPETLFESELFGHLKGAFTDARQNREGRFSQASGGTLFLDEIATLSESQQAKLLRVLESGEYEPVGSDKTRHADCRLISATNADLEARQAQGAFRQDLYFRLNTIELTVPPLRQRGDEIIPLARHFIAQHARRYDLPQPALSACACNALQAYHWPGNVRELSHIMERAVLMCDEAELSARQLPVKTASTEVDSPVSELITLEQAEQKLIKMALAQCLDNVEDASVLLGISKSALYRRMDKFNIKTRQP
ncbi:sigma-54 dependent transcriptional regulator [Pseudoalteromonas sp. OOF1S-7]|uniref:sigma-54-dependent transcriptional regulator n=1 Tax=Pseudoalteromonas sp. OOF1S-7 TaxID=2917757 RepID=UPI001EF543C9|nr:sigma-54 dependent transcriptional regulator [Pseudoalteromonas sp. OOF1S-7]MCG7537362.1 sigma-54 dependent transcriptional regulator [Pseudoalteromonas sp. OOF1S-7]